MIVAAKMKAEGQKPGVPDYQLPVRRGDCPGWVGELKRVDLGKVSAEQEKWLAHYKVQGWATALCEGWGPLWDSLYEYLLLDDTTRTQWP